MRGKFIGKSSMIFKNGNIYDIYSKVQKIRKGGTIFGEDMYCICIYDSNTHIGCPYDNLEAVLKNWEFK